MFTYAVAIEEGAGPFEVIFLLGCEALIGGSFDAFASVPRGGSVYHAMIYAGIVQ